MIWALTACNSDRLSASKRGAIRSPYHRITERLSNAGRCVSRATFMQ